ncbi:type VI secretion system baseplate subunit TssG [Ideonella azotifigens]|uniref:Type VI secretion system baseplate subunit TssG n=2 Tax=Ideonella azotifigens TaxID=513160 RepID=A0ABN1KI31_9BURK|nr:type VI secretion system baseplate subunit TssG [Ideonella azotifigens]MCD2339617.1 type VI secretion system baseplate subunit TssG [Ideonella azotifigens]
MDAARHPLIPAPAAALTPPRAAPARALLASAVDRLFAEPHRFGFHQAVRLLQRWADSHDAASRPELQFRNTLSLSFPASEIAALERHARQPAQLLPQTGTGPAADALAASLAELPAAAPVPERIELTPAFMGLLGVMGTLPLSYTEQFLAREVYDRDGAARAFLDIFQHRAVSLFHEAWRKHRLPLAFEADPQRQFRPMALALAGLGLQGLQGRMQAPEGAVADDAVAFYAGHLQQRVIGARQLQQMLADYLGLPVTLTQFVGRWFSLEADNCTSLGLANATLGSDALIGDRVWQRDLRVRLSIGPMTRTQHRRFLPGGPGALALKQLVTLATGISLEYEVRLCLKAEEIAPAQLGEDPQQGGAHLGWNTFLLSGPSATDREEAAYDIHAAA